MTWTGRCCVCGGTIKEGQPCYVVCHGDHEVEYRHPNCSEEKIQQPKDYVEGETLFPEDPD